MKAINICCALLFACSAANEPIPVLPPTVKTILVSVTDTLAIVVCKSNATIHGIRTENDFIQGDTIKIITIPRKKYEVKAYAQNGAGMFYGETISFYAVCPSNFAGQINYSTQVLSTSGPGACPNPVTGTITLKDNLDGTYGISDGSFGLYGCAWYDSPAVGITLYYSCGVITLSGKDQYNISFNYSVNITGGVMVLDWFNDYGDYGRTELDWK